MQLSVVDKFYKTNMLITIHFKLFTHVNLSEPFHVTNGFRQGGILSPYFFAVYLYDLSLELNDIKAGRYIGEVLLNHLMFADDICVLFPSVRGLQSMLDVRQVYAESHEIFFKSTAAKLFVWHLRLRPQKARLSRCWHWVYKV